MRTRQTGRREVCKGLLSTGLGAACGTAEAPSDHGAPAPIETIDLPEARTTSAISIEAALWARRSVRAFRDETVALADLGQLLWACQGLNRPELGGRTMPSAGARYPLEVYVLTAEGIHHYVPEGHQLERFCTEDVRDRIPAQSFVRPAPVVVVIAAVFARTAERYGARAERYVHLEAGHAAHGLLLQAVSLGLGATPVGSFDDEELQLLLGIPVDHEPLYVVPIGVPA